MEGEGFEWGEFILPNGDWRQEGADPLQASVLVGLNGEPALDLLPLRPLGLLRE